MPRGVGVPQRVVAHITEAVELLRVAGIGNQGVRLHEEARHGVVVARLVKVQLSCFIPPLPGELVSRGRGAVRVAVLAPGLVAPLRLLAPAGVSCDGAAPQVISFFPLHHL